MLNSAPLQLLPVDYGNDHQKKISQQVKPEEPGKSFNDVLESAVQKNEPKRSASERPKESAGNSQDRNDSTGISGNGPDSKEAEENIRAEAGKNGTRKTGAGDVAEKNEKSGKRSGRKSGKIAAETEIPEGKGKEGLAAFFAGRPETAKPEESKFPKTGKDAVSALQGKNILKFSAAGQSETIIPEIGIEKTGGKEKKSGKSSSVTLREGGKLSSEAAEKLLAAAGGVKGARIKAAVDGSINGHSRLAGGKDPLKAGRDGRDGSKLRVTDHRKTSELQQEGKTFKISSSESFKTAGASSDETGKTIELNAAPDSGKAEGRTAQPRTVQSAVLSQLKEGVNDQIVKQAGIIVKGNGNGEIKLVMKPEQLGKVRIQLSLNDNHIAGRIIVENNIVREIFESNLENLYKAFGSEGFENGGLEVTVQGGDSDGPGKRSSGGMNRRAVQAIDDAVPEIVETEWQNNAVNMVV